MQPCALGLVYYKYYIKATGGQFGHVGPVIYESEEINICLHSFSLSDMTELSV